MGVEREDGGTSARSGRSDPDVVRRQGGTRPSEVRHDFGIVTTDLAVDGKLFNHRTRKKLPEVDLVLFASASEKKPGPELTEDDRGNADPFRRVEKCGYRFFSSLISAVGRRVQAQPTQRHISGSTCEKGATASSNCRRSSSLHRPANRANPLLRSAPTPRELARRSRTV